MSGPMRFVIPAGSHVGVPLGEPRTGAERRMVPGTHQRPDGSWFEVPPPLPVRLLNRASVAWTRFLLWLFVREG